VQKSGWSVNGKLEEAEGMFAGLIWLIRVAGEGCFLENKVD
jgi:hypothetical protein